MRCRKFQFPHPPPVYSDSEFRRHFRALCINLNRMLGVEVSKGGQHLDCEVGYSVAKVRALHQQGNQLERDFRLKKLERLTAELLMFEGVAPALFEEARRILVLPDREGYFGIRAEMLTASLLVEDGVDFEKSESPDFNIELPYGRMSIEVTSAHVQGPRDWSLAYKLQAAIKRKGEKPYANPNTALFIDATNIAYMNALGVEESLHGIGEEIQTAVRETPFGAAVVLSLLFLPDGSLSPRFARYDGRRGSLTLTRFLDLNYRNSVEFGPHYLTPKS